MTHDVPADRLALSPPISRFFSAEDGLRLHAREWPAPEGAAFDARPAICLPGLARTAADFDLLAARLRRSRRVVALDYRAVSYTHLTLPTIYSV